LRPQAPARSPQDWIASAPPQEWKDGNVARCFGSACRQRAVCSTRERQLTLCALLSSFKAQTPRWDIPSNTSS
jgi:hypothetical protein